MWLDVQHNLFDVGINIFCSCWCSYLWENQGLKYWFEYHFNWYSDVFSEWCSSDAWLIFNVSWDTCPTLVLTCCMQIVWIFLQEYWFWFFTLYSLVILWDFTQVVQRKFWHITCVFSFTISIFLLCNSFSTFIQLFSQFVKLFENIDPSCRVRLLVMGITKIIAHVRWSWGWGPIPIIPMAKGVTQHNSHDT